MMRFFTRAIARLPHTRLKRRKGFSAIEMLVVTALFAIASLTVAATYINFTRLHRRVANAEYLGEEMRFAMELMVRLARNNVINYPVLPNALVSPTSTLSLESLTSATTTLIRQFATSSAVCAGLNASCLGLSSNAGTSWAAITGKNVNIDRFSVYVMPVRDPFQTIGVGAYDNNEQPRVTFMIDASYVATSTLERSSMSVQTSVSNRVYLR